MIPQYEILADNSRRRIIRIPFPKFAIFIVCLPLFGFIFCIVWSILFYFHRSTATHCEVKNYLPSVSAAVGNYYPQRTIWQLCISIQFLPRLIIAKVYFTYYVSALRKQMKRLGQVTFVLSILENLSLLGLSLYTSVDHYEIHKLWFIVFIASSEAYMCMCCWIVFLVKNSSFSGCESKSVRLKIILFFVNVSSTAGAGYCFIRHNKYCEPGVYSVFALLEYMVVLSNMAFHTVAYHDFHRKIIVVDCSSGLPKIVL